MKRSIALLTVSVMLVLAMALAGCGTKAAEQPTQPQVQAEQPAATQEATPAEQPTATPGQPATQATSLKIQDIVKGKGATAVAGKQLLVDYTLWYNGTKLESSKDSGQPFPFVLGAGQVIPGWDQGIVGMKVGGKRKLTVPPELAYGAQGSPPVPPNATLVFEVDLLKVQ